MENRKVDPTPVSDERPKKAKYDDFEPPGNSGGPTIEDKPTPPPGSTNVGAALPCPSPNAAGK
jgi:hypothetical protein